MLDLKRKNNRVGGNIMVLRDIVYFYLLFCIMQYYTYVGICSVLNCNVYVIITFMSHPLEKY